jgi:hypothetical protein
VRKCLRLFAVWSPSPSTWVTPLIDFAAIGLPASGSWEIQTVERMVAVRLDADVLTADAIRPTEAEKYDMGLISVLIGVLVIVVVGAICFWAIDKFANDRRLANLLKLLVVLICLGAILQRVLPLTY